MRCCGPRKPLIHFERVDFGTLSQIIVNLTRKTLAEREAEITNLPWTQTEKDTALARCRSRQRAWRKKRNPCCLSVLSLMKRAIPWKTKMNQKEGFVSLGEPFSEHVWRPRDITCTKIFYDLSKWLLVTSAGLLIRPSLTTSLLYTKIRLLALPEF